jgi:hypothetical protein
MTSTGNLHNLYDGRELQTCMRLCAKKGMLVAEKSASILRQGSCCSLSSISVVMALPSNASSASCSTQCSANLWTAAGYLAASRPRHDPHVPASNVAGKLRPESMAMPLPLNASSASWIIHIHERVARLPWKACWKCSLSL